MYFSTHLRPIKWNFLHLIPLPCTYPIYLRVDSCKQSLSVCIRNSPFHVQLIVVSTWWSLHLHFQAIWYLHISSSLGMIFTNDTDHLIASYVLRRPSTLALHVLHCSLSSLAPSPLYSQFMALMVCCAQDSSSWPWRSVVPQILGCPSPLHGPS